MRERNGQRIEVDEGLVGDSLVEVMSASVATLPGRSVKVTCPERERPVLANVPWMAKSNNIDLDSLYECCVPARDSLLVMVNKYRRKLKLPALSASTEHSWTDVDTELQSACTAMEAVAARDSDFSGSVGKLRRAFRMLCHQAGCGNTFVSLIPNDAFGFSSMLCGGLKVIFTGLYQTALYREEVYRTLEDLPYILADHSTPLSLPVCGEDEELHRRTALMYVSVFKLLEHLLGWFAKNTFVTRMKLIVDPGFSDNLKERVAEVKLRAQRWERRALRLSMQNQNAAVQLQIHNTVAQSRIDDNVQKILNRTEEIEDRLSRSKILESLDSFLHVIVSTLDKRLESSQPTRQAKLLAGADTRAAILEDFQYEPDLMPSDCAAVLSCLNQGHHSRSRLNGTRIVLLQKNPRLQAWLTMDESSLLLVNGRTRAQPHSEATVVSAQIFQRLLDVAGDVENRSTILVPLAIFCGQHRDARRDPNGNPAEAAMSLLLQLVDRAGTRVPAAVLKKCRAETTPLNIASICASLERILLSLSSKVIVVLLVDGIKFFTNPDERRDQTRDLVERLAAVFRKKTKAILKLLFSSPTRSEFIEDLFEDGEILSLARDLPQSGVRGSDGRFSLQLPTNWTQSSGNEEESTSSDEENSESSDPGEYSEREGEGFTSNAKR
ncbi:hypothetical protein B0T14DRAFT_565599 [Immersiella caudata]|uniref:Uncharacterized protein n=1 Tax=Immersiella caudata TaxID=314043 RepID=A0AA40C4D1_9PEZI|nr:hypothetical protein B0T14DRAFT_565599 [Immersiella caudata]